MASYKKQARDAYERWQRSDMDELYKAYGSASSAKWNAWEHCKETCYVLGGWGLRVITKNTYMFTAGFLFEKDGVTKFCHITPTHKEIIEVA